MIRVRNGDRYDMAAALAGNGVAATAVVPESIEARAGEVGFIPSDEDDRVAGPSLRIHDGADRVAEKGIARGNQRRHLGKIAGVVGSGGPPVHVMTLVRTDPGVVGHFAAGQVGRKLTEVDNIGHARWVALHVLIRNEGVVLAFVELVAARVIKRSGAKRVRLHVGLPGFAVGLDLIHDVSDVDGGVAVVSDAVRGAVGCGNVVWLTGVGYAEVVACQTIVGSRGV